MPALTSTVFAWSLIILFYVGTARRIYIANRKTRKVCTR